MNWCPLAIYSGGPCWLRVRGHILAKSAKNFSAQNSRFSKFFFVLSATFASLLACAWCVRAHSNQIENTAQYSNCMKIIHVNWMNRYVQYVTNISIHVSHSDVTVFFLFLALCVRVVCVAWIPCIFFCLFTFCTFWNYSHRFNVVEIQSTVFCKWLEQPETQVPFCCQFGNFIIIIMKNQKPSQLNSSSKIDSTTKKKRSKKKHPYAIICAHQPKLSWQEMCTGSLLMIWARDMLEMFDTETRPPT